MSELRNLTDKEIKLITSGVENQKLDVIRILKSRVKVYKLTQTELKKIKQRARLSVIWKRDNRNPVLKHGVNLLLNKI